MRTGFATRTALLAIVAVAVTAGSSHAQQSVMLTERSVVLTGRVVAAGDGDPVAGAEVRAVGHPFAAISRADGTWRLEGLSAGAHELLIQHIAFADRRMTIHGDARDPVNVELTPKPVSLSALVITAARRSQQLKDAVIATEVVGRAELRRTGATDLAAVLVERTGVTQEGGHPVGSGVMLQGLGSERVLVLMDGEPMLGRLSGKLDLSRLPVSMIERVEVVKGPQSTLYGSDAMAGVVNVITRAPDRGEWRGGVDVIGGSRDRLDVGAHALGGIGDVGLSLDAGRRTIELVPGYLGEAGTFSTRWDGAAKARWEPNADLSLSAGAVLLDESQRWKSGALYNFADNVQWGARAGLRWTHGSVVISPMLYATEFRHLSRRSTLSEPVAGSGEEESQRLIKADLLLALDMAAVDIDAGIEAHRDGISSDRVQGASRAAYGVEPFVQTTFSGETWSVVPGARLSWSEQWGSHFTPRIAALLRPVPSLALRASVGQGFRAPSFKELYIEFLNTGAGDGYRVRGNPALRPETSRNVTASVEWAGDRVYARTQVFHNRFDDFIETVELVDSSGMRLFTYGNIENGMTWGTEVELGATWGGMRAEAGYAYLVAEDRRTGASLLGRPRHSGRSSIGYTHASGLRATLTGVVTGRTLVARTDSADVSRSAFTRFDVRASQLLPHGFELSIGIDNIAGTQPEHWPGFVSRQLHVGLGWRHGRDEH